MTAKPISLVAAVLFVVLSVGPAWSQARGGAKKGALPDVDLRAPVLGAESSRNSPTKALVDRRTRNMEAFVAQRQAVQPGIRIVPSRHGIPKLMLSDGKALSSASDRDPDEIARNFLRDNSAVFSFTQPEIDQLRLDVRDIAPESTHLVYNQTVNGIDVFQGQIKFTLSKTGEVIQVGSSEAAPGLIISTVLRLRPEQAELAARTASRAETGGKLLRAPELVIFPLDAATARLAYRLYLNVDAAHLYEILIDAEDGKLLFRHNSYVHAAQGRVWTQSPSQGGSRQLVTFPDAWLPATATVTTGNNADVFLDTDGDDQPDPVTNTQLQNGRPSSASQVFDFPFGDGTVGLDPRNFQGASGTNLFYFVNIAHDFYYSLGFTEAAGNFQTDNLGEGGVGGDAVIAEAQNPFLEDDAAFAPTPEGIAPYLRMGLFTRSTTSPFDDLDSAYDGQVVVHEYGHGVSNRLVGGLTNMSCLGQIQSGAMGEGWSDYFAISYFNNPVFGAYVSQDMNHGVRRQSYEGYTFTYEDVGNSGYEVHDDGEIWAATLWDLRKSLGQTITDLLVLNGLKATPCNPSMTDARDAILSADLASNSGANRLSLWTVFAKHGLGYSARGIDGSQQTGTVYDAAYDLPPDLQNIKNPAITSQPVSTIVGVGELYAYTVAASNPNGGVLNFLLTSGPDGMLVSPTGTVNWIASFTGQRVKITVTDGKGGKVVHGYFVPTLTDLATGQSVVIGGAKDSTGYAYIIVPSKVPILQVTLRDGTGDADLFVADPDGNPSFSARDGNTETLSFANPKPGRWQVEANGFDVYSFVSLTASLVTPTLLSSNTVLNNLGGVTGSEAFYRVTIPPNAVSFQVSTIGLKVNGGNIFTGDVDLYLKYGSPALCQSSLRVSTGCSYDYSSANVGDTDSITVVNPASGDWYIDLSAFDAFSGVGLTTSLLNPPRPDLTISIAPVSTVIPGQIGVQYLATVTNVGTGPTFGDVSVSYQLPITGYSLTYGGGGDGWKCCFPWTRNDVLAPSSSYPPLLLFILDISTTAPASIVAVATVSGGGELNTANDTASDMTVVLQPDLTIALSHAGTFKPGQTGATYSIAVTNTGTSATTGAVSVIDSLPAGLTATAISGTGWTCTLGTLTCTRSDVLATSGTYPPITVTVNIAASAASTVTNAATVSGGGEINTANNTAQDLTGIGTGPVIALVANAFGENPLIAPNTWVEIKGLNLAPAGDSRFWLSSDFLNNQLPTKLDGVSVTVNGKSAYLYYISPTELKILTPPDALSGSMQVQLTNNGVTSNVASVQGQAQSPSFFDTVSTSGVHYVLGTHAGDGSLIGPSSLFPNSSRPVEPGESIYLIANGLGPTDTPVVSGSLAQTGNLAVLPAITIGGITAKVSSAGLIGIGTYAIKLTVPSNVPDGDLLVSATYNGSSTQPNVTITVQH